MPASLSISPLIRLPQGRPKEGDVPLGGTARRARERTSIPPGRPKEGGVPVGGTARSARVHRRLAGIALVAALSCAFTVRAQTTNQAPPAATDQTPPIAIPPELSDAARRAYNQGLKEAGDLLTQKKYAPAIARIDALIAQRPREPQARFLKGIVQTEQGNTEAAFATFRALVEDYPELPEPHNNLAVLYAQKGDYDIAKSELEIAIKTAPDWPVAHENLGDVYARLAASQYDRAGSLDKANKTAPAKLALVRQLLAPPAAKPKS